MNTTTTETYKQAFASPPGTNLEACAKHAKGTFGASKVYIIASGTLSRTTDRVDRLADALRKAGVEVVGIRKGVTPHTKWSNILSIAAECREAGADCLVTLGAGSITDGAKLVVLCLANDISKPSQLAQYSIESPKIPSDVKPPTVPLITIPTSLSGGEYFSLAGGTDDATGHKQGFLHSGMGSRLVILDPELATLTPAYHWLSTGVRAIDHCVEAMCSPTATPEHERLAADGLRLLVPGLLRCKADLDGRDVDARMRCQKAVIHAMDNVRAGLPLGGSHAIGHQLGPLGVPHGVTSCICCPAVMKYNMRHGAGDPDIAARQKKVRDVLWGEPDVAKSLEAPGLDRDKADLGDLLDAIVRALGLPRTLKEMDISPDVIPALSKRALADFWAPTNPIPLVRPEQVEEILRDVGGY